MTRDEILGIIFAITGLLAFALSFTLLDADGRPILFSASLGIALVCLAFIRNKRGAIFGFAAFVVVRLLVGLMKA
jgi:hypothetical protein